MKNHTRNLELETKIAAASLLLPIAFATGGACSEGQPIYHFFTTSINIWFVAACGWGVSALWNLMVTRPIENAENRVKDMMSEFAYSSSVRHLRDDVYALNKKLMSLEGQVTFLMEREIENTSKQDAINQHYGISVKKVESEYRVEELS